VVRHVAAALDFEHLDAAAPQRLRIQGEACFARPAAEGDDRRVLEEEEEVGALAAGQAVVGEAALEGEGVAVGDRTEIRDGEGAAHGEEVIEVTEVMDVTVVIEVTRRFALTAVTGAGR
jgi:hypothetical protein